MAEPIYPTTPRPQKQRWTVKDAPEHVGDCWRTAIAILLGMDRDDVPHFLGGEGPGEGLDWYLRTNKWLREQGWQITREPDIHAIMGGHAQLPDHGYFIASGITFRSTDHFTSDEPWARYYRELREFMIHHAVVVSHDFKEIIDPHPEDSGLYAYTSFTIIEKAVRD